MIFFSLIGKCQTFAPIRLRLLPYQSFPIHQQLDTCSGHALSYNISSDSWLIHCEHGVLMQVCTPATGPRNVVPSYVILANRPWLRFYYKQYQLLKSNGHFRDHLHSTLDPDTSDIPKNVLINSDALKKLKSYMITIILVHNYQSFELTFSLHLQI